MAPATGEHAAGGAPLRRPSDELSGVAERWMLGRKGMCDDPAEKNGPAEAVGSKERLTKNTWLANVVNVCIGTTGQQNDSPAILPDPHNPAWRPQNKLKTKIFNTSQFILIYLYSERFK